MNIGPRRYVWGRGEYGRLGLGDHTAKSRLLPVLNEFFEEEGGQKTLNPKSQP